MKTAIVVGVFELIRDEVTTNNIKITVSGM